MAIAIVAINEVINKIYDLIASSYTHTHIQLNGKQLTRAHTHKQESKLVYRTGIQCDSSWLLSVDMSIAIDSLLCSHQTHRSLNGHLNEWMVCMDELNVHCPFCCHVSCLMNQFGKRDRAHVNERRLISIAESSYCCCCCTSHCILQWSASTNLDTVGDWSSIIMSRRPEKISFHFTFRAYSSSLNCLYCKNRVE